MNTVTVELTAAQASTLRARTGKRTAAAAVRAIINASVGENVYQKAERRIGQTGGREFDSVDEAFSWIKK